MLQLLLLLLLLTAVHRGQQQPMVSVLLLLRKMLSSSMGTIATTNSSSSSTSSSSSSSPTSILGSHPTGDTLPCLAHPRLAIVHRLAAGVLQTELLLTALRQPAPQAARVEGAKVLRPVDGRRPREGRGRRRGARNGRPSLGFRCTLRRTLLQRGRVLRHLRLPGGGEEAGETTRRRKHLIPAVVQQVKVGAGGRHRCEQRRQPIAHVQQVLTAKGEILQGGQDGDGRLAGVHADRASVVWGLLLLLVVLVGVRMVHYGVVWICLGREVVEEVVKVVVVVIVLVMVLEEVLVMVMMMVVVVTVMTKCRRRWWWRW